MKQLKCYFCSKETKPNYKEFEVLKKFVSDRGRIVGRSRTGTCAKHQKQVTQEIKRARHLALLPFVA